MKNRIYVEQKQYLMNKQILLTLLLVSGSVLPGCVHSPAPSRESVAIAASTHTMDSVKSVADGRLGKAQVVAAQPNTTRLQEQLNNLDLSSAQGTVGIGVLDLNTGERWFSNGKQRFPMQSVYKLPISIVVLKLVDEGKLSLNQTVTITRDQFAPGWNPTIKDIKGNRAQFTLQYLLEKAVGNSDNTAADALVRLVGGPSQVTANLERLNIRDVRVDRLVQQLVPDSVGLTNFRPELMDKQKYEEALGQIPDAVKKAALERFLNDPRDTATPEGMIDLLVKLQSRQLLSEDSTALLLKIMTDTPTGQQRLKAGLPPGWSIAHKTGTGHDVLGIGIAANNVGLISSPTGKHIAIAVFIAGSKAPLEQRESVMSAVASAVIQAMQ
jgi:beta-lactamase class A